MKTPQLGEWLIWIGTIAVLVWVVWLLTGCASRQSVTEVEYLKGCHIKVRNVEHEEASQIMQEIRFKDCEAGKNIDVGGKVD